MPDINPAIPQVGQPNSSEEPKIVTALTQLVAAVNDVDDTQLQSPNNALYRPLLTAQGMLQSGMAAGTNYFLAQNFLASGGAGTLNPIPHVYLDPAVYAVNNKAFKARLQVSLITNSITPGVNITAGIGTLNAAGGATNSVSVAITPVSSVTFTAPTATNGFNSASADFVPAAAYYGFYVAVSAPLPANFGAALAFALQYRYV